MLHISEPLALVPFERESASDQITNDARATQLSLALLTSYGTVQSEFSRSDTVAGHANNALQILRFALELDEPLTPLDLLGVVQRLAAIVALERLTLVP